MSDEEITVPAQVIDETPNADGMVNVSMPSGAIFPVHVEEVDYIKDRSARYLLDNHFCLPAGRLVYTLDGPKPIEAVRVGEEIWSVQDGAVSIDTVTDVSSTSPKPVIELCSQNRTLRCSPDHKVLVRTRTVKPKTGDGGKTHKGRVSRRLCQLLGCDRGHYAKGWCKIHYERSVRHPERAVTELTKETGNRFTWSNEWKRASEVEVGDIVVTLAELPDAGIDTVHNRYLSIDFMEFAGLYIGDGVHITTEAVIRISTPHDAVHMPHYCAVLGAEFRQNKGTPVTLRQLPDYVEVSTQCGYKELKNLGLTGYSTSVTVPPWVFRSDAKRRAAFLRGYLDADGSVTPLGRIQFTCANQVLASQTRSLCMGLGVPVTNVYQIRVNSQYGETDAWSFTCSDAKANREVISSWDPRYLKIWENSKGFSEGHNSQYYAYPDRHRVPINPPTGCGYARIVRKIEFPPEPMFDLSTASGHNYIADGVIVHNSNVSDAQDFDRMLIMELMCYRWGTWISQQKDYWNDPVDESKLQESLKQHSGELRQLKKALGIDKVSRDKARGEDSVPAYIKNLLQRAKEFGVTRESQLAKALELFNELQALVTLHKNCDAVERQENHCNLEDILEWLTEIAIPEYNSIDEYFRKNKQSMYIRSM